MFYDTWTEDISLHGGIPKVFSSIKNKVFKEQEIPPWELRVYKNKKLGEDRLTEVYLAMWKETYVVAKVIKPTFNSYLYLKEIDNMIKTHHPNIKQILGYVENPFIIVMKYFPNMTKTTKRHNMYKFFKEIVLYTRKKI